DEATPLLCGLNGVVSQPKIVLQKILEWTSGQPFLTQKLCQLVVQIGSQTANGRIDLPQGTEGYWVEQLVHKQIIQHWESKDEPEHLRTIRDRLLFDQQKAARLLGLYQQVLQAEEQQVNSPVALNDSREQTELLLSGLVKRQDGYLKIKNPIYRCVFNQQWVVRQLDSLRPYSQIFNAWVLSGYEDESRLLRGQALKDAQSWAQGKSLSDLDYQFLVASQECERREVQIALEAARVQQVEARLAQQKKTALLQKYLLVVLGIGFLISTSLGIGNFIVYQECFRNQSELKILPPVEP
ncbi:MAG: hypothetical protein KAF91_30200, partial [Nostoc sp. TH1S01]|nr:hypothetical protein [Nostoc sp. TH1S01]